MSDKTEHSNLPEAFAALGVRPSILRALANLKFTEPSEIQRLLIPRALAGIDLLGQARTGTGKTAAFGIPILQRATKGVPGQALILVPTRELAVQVDAEIKRLSEFTPIRSVPIYGGQKISVQVKLLKHHPEIIVGTPGRVIDMLERRIIHLNNVRFVVLDEVDRMLDIGFRDDIRRILSQIRKSGQSAVGGGPDEGSQKGSGFRAQGSAAADVDSDALSDSASQSPEPPGQSPSHPQTVFVSATISPEIERLARQYMREPVEKLIAPGADEKPTVAEVEQYYLSVQVWDKYRLLRQLLVQENPDLAIVFCKTKRGAEKVAKKLHADGIECREIHGNLNQSQRDRVMKSFRGGKFEVLIATDLASRGLDVADISHIINFDIPEDPEIYIHRIGRTARMGAKGKAFTFVLPDQGDELTRVESLINMVIHQARVEGFEPSPEPSAFREFGSSRAPEPAPTPVREETATVTIPARPRSLGSKIPRTRRRRRR